MDQVEIEQSIKIVLNKEHSDLASGINTLKIASNENPSIISYDHFNTLAEIYELCKKDKSAASLFKQTLVNDLVFAKETIHKIGDVQYYASSAGLSFYTLWQLGLYDYAIIGLANRIEQIGSFSLVNSVYRVLDSFLFTDQFYGPTHQIGKLSDTIRDQNVTLAPNSTKQFHSRILRKLSALAYSQLKRELKGVNLEINKDKQVLNEKIRELRFDDKYINFLEETDRLLHEKSEVVSSAMIGSLRSFMEELLTAFSERICQLSNETLPDYGTDIKKMGRVRKYLKEKLELSDTDHKFIDSFIDILHKEGGHSFTSKPEYFRLTRNIAIELALLLTSKFETKYNLKTN